MTYTCPVCGYDKLEEPAANHNICECCGTQFGYHDLRFTHAELRERWVDGGMKWYSLYIEPPQGWNPVSQLLRAGYELAPTT